MESAISKAAYVSKRCSACTDLSFLYSLSFMLDGFRRLTRTSLRLDSALAYYDRGLIVLNKPTGIVSQGSRKDSDISDLLQGTCTTLNRPKYRYLTLIQ